jgi:LacI family transcriptional regulator
MDDVARAAGYSTATVSRVLNKSTSVAEKTRRAVMRAMEDLDYVPDSAARTLVTQSSRTIGVIVPTIENMTYAIGISALQQRLRQSGFTLLISTSAYDLDLEFQEANTLVARGVDGIMLVGGIHHPELFKLLEARGVAYVITWVLDEKLPSIGFDNKESGARIANYLIGLGHSNIAVIASMSKTNDRAAARVTGIREALAMSKLPFPEGHIIQGLGSIGEGKAAVRALIAMEPMPTAVICLNDTLAFGAFLEARRHGISIPRDLSIVGFDDLDYAAELSPSLTTVRIPAAEMGSAAAEYLLARIAKRPTAHMIEIPANLIVRDSTCPPGSRSSPTPGK